MRVIGIDPGSQHMGWGVVEAHGSRLAHIASGTVHAPRGALVMRLCHMAEHLEAVLQKYKPVAASVESIFHAKNSLAALNLGHARGVILVSLGRAGLPVHEYTPGQIKQAATGNGRADKVQVQTMVRMLLGLVGGASTAADKDDSLDTTDALAAALCHVQRADSAVTAILVGGKR